jgi:hypothetical protein
VLYVGRAQEKASVVRTERRYDRTTGASYAWLVKATAPLRAQRPPRRHPRPAGILRAARLTRRPRLLRPATRRAVGYRAALRQLGNRLVGILHGCLKTGATYDEHIAQAATKQSHAAT